jgi:nucleoside-diphosphate-sugar epimerase
MSLLPSNGEIILITGLNGYIATHLALHFLSRGHTIHGTVRNPTELSSILNSPTFQPFTPRIRTFIIPDLTLPGAFSSAVIGVHQILHLATPINFWFARKREVIDVAVNGTLNLIEAAKDCAGEQLENFVYFSSLSAVIDSASPPPSNLPFTYTAENWNNSALAALDKIGQDKEAPFSILYPASKILAERAVFEFRSQNPGLGFKIWSVVSAMVLGPPMLFPENAEGINGTIKPILEVMKKLKRGEGKEIEGRKVGSGWFVDAGDLVKVVDWVSGRKGADGERVLVVGGRAETERLGRILGGVDMIEAIAGEEKSVEKLKGDDEGKITFDTRFADDALEGQWINYEKSVMDTSRALERYL